MIPIRDQPAGVDDFAAEVKLARRDRQRHLASALCGRRFTHPRWPRQFDARAYLLVNTCLCVRPSGHRDGCVCEHDVERRVFRVDRDGREQYATRSLNAEKR
ncbi:MAG TPA: hypothetical protein VFE97_12635 [Methylomirabilota bacterium]|jgi:hypothetical protein|nr:hypothetical protein [Methylomirabilota bacterium]